MARPFQGIRGDQVLPHYDGVIVGAGIGGLVCANLLAIQGRRILLVENHTVVGGYCSTFYRKGFTFDSASHFYPLLGNPDSLSGKLLQVIGVNSQWKRMDPVDQFHLPDGSRFSVVADYDQYLAQLKSRFPHQAEALDEFFKLVRKLYFMGLLHFFHETELSRGKEYLAWTVRDAMDAFFDCEQLKLVLTADCPHWGAPPCRTSFVFDSMLRLSYFSGNYYPVDGSQAFANELARNFESHGGHVLLKSRVQRICVSENRVEGVELETGPLKRRRKVTVNAGHVVSNADLRQTVTKMIPPNVLPRQYVQDVLQLKPSYSCFLMHVGLRGVSTETLERIHGYYWRDWDSDRVGADAFQFKLFVPTLYEPALAPEGCHVLVVQKVIEFDYDSVAHWPSHKKAIEDFVYRELGRIIPNLESHIVVSLSASAKTSERYTMNYQGAMIGFEMSPEQLGERRPSIQTPVENLLLTGQWTRPGGGITPVVISAMRCAQQIMGQARFDDVLKSRFQREREKPKDGSKLIPLMHS